MFAHERVFTIHKHTHIHISTFTYGGDHYKSIVANPQKKTSTTNTYNWQNRMKKYKGRNEMMKKRGRRRRTENKGEMLYEKLLPFFDIKCICSDGGSGYETRCGNASENETANGFTIFL